MKRIGYLYDSITSFANIYEATQKAQKSKRFRPNVLLFNHNLEAEIFKLQTELQTQTYQPGEYRAFYIYEPKPRLISAAPYRDRVVHHALFQVLNPIIEPSFIHHSYANRVGFGTHRALRRFTKLCRSYRYILQCDIRRYFPNIDHDLLKSQLRRRLKCHQTLWLLEQIIDHSNRQESDLEYFPGDDLFTPYERSKGLPIGNLTSQFFANLYLNQFDHFILQSLKVPGYLRYMDDFALFSNDRDQLAQARIALESALDQLRLRIHPIKSQLFETGYGANFVGFRVFPRYIRVRNDSLRRLRDRLKQLQCRYQHQQVSLPRVQQSLASWNAHLNHGETWNIRRAIFADLPADWIQSEQG
jgi:retron-type reverse transcriptase